MKICLVFPPIDKQEPDFAFNLYPPLGLLSLAGFIKKSGFEVIILDCLIEDMDYKKFRTYIKNIQPDIVGISMLSIFRYSGIFCAEIVKNINPKIITIMGGIHATHFHNLLLEKFSFIDAVVRGEGEYTLLSLLKGEPWNTIPGLSYRENGIVKINSNRIENKSLENFSLPAYDLVPMKKYSEAIKKYHKRFPATGIITSRGCYGKCDFCSIPGMWDSVRSFSAEYIINQIEYLSEKYGIKDLYFFDDMFPVSKSWFKQFYDLYKLKKIDITFRCNSRVTIMDDELLSMMKECGCYSIQYGVESGSDKILKGINKYITVEKVRNAVAKTAAADIMVGCFFMIGFENEEIEDIYQTLELIKELKLNITVISITMLFPGSKMYWKFCTDHDIWFNREIFNKSKNKQEVFFPIFKHPFLTDKEVREIAMYMSYKSNIRNFWRNFEFNSEIVYHEKYFKIKSFLKTLIDLVGSATIIKNNPLSKYEKDSYSVLTMFMVSLKDILKAFKMKTIILKLIKKMFN